jgi:hypothetical protein
MHPLCSFIVGYSSKIYLNGQKQKKQTKKITPMTRPKPFPTKDVNNVSEYVSKNLEVAKGVIVALGLKCH